MPRTWISHDFDWYPLGLTILKALYTSDPLLRTFPSSGIYSQSCIWSGRGLFPNQRQSRMHQVFPFVLSIFSTRKWQVKKKSVKTTQIRNKKWNASSIRKRKLGVKTLKNEQRNRKRKVGYGKCVEHMRERTNQPTKYGARISKWSHYCFILLQYFVFAFFPLIAVVFPTVLLVKLMLLLCFCLQTCSQW